MEGTSRTSPLEPEILTKGTEWILFGYGGGVPLALEARALAERSNLPVPTVVDLACIQPFPARTLRAMLEGHSFAVAVEEGYAAGGIGEALSAFAQTMDHPCRVSCAGVPARFVPQGTVEEQSPRTVAAYRARLTAKLQEVLEQRPLDQQRIIAEAAIVAERLAVDEETVRLRSHMGQLREILGTSDAVGRKLDFLVQEMNREANTIGSKCQDVTISQTVVDMKSEIEKIREQIQNIE